MLLHAAQASFGRTCRITLKLAGTYSSTSATSSPILLHRRAAVGAGAGRGVLHRLARQVLGQWPTCRAFLLLGLGCRDLGRARLPAGAVGFQLLDQELQLLDLRVELLGGATELQPAELGDEELECSIS